jgi:hypothetical protein
MNSSEHKTLKHKIKHWNTNIKKQNNYRSLPSSTTKLLSKRIVLYFLKNKSHWLLHNGEDEFYNEKIFKIFFFLICYTGRRPTPFRTPVTMLDC